MSFPPKTLHCYFSFEDGIKLLTTRKFRLHSVRSFNDPFEFLIKTDYPKFFLNLKETFSVEDIDNHVTDLGKDKLFINEQKVKRKAIDYVTRMKECRIGCFSETNNNILMWSHYGRKHTGMVISFSTAMDYWGNDIHKVEYLNQRVAYQERTKNYIAGDKWQKELLVRKSDLWSYEREWRYIKMSRELKCDKMGHYKDINKECIQEVIIGCRQSDNNIALLREILNRSWNEVPLKVTSPDKSNFSISIETLL